MIVLNTEELIAVNAMIDNVPIYGVPVFDLDLPEEQRIANVITSLQKKEVMSEQALTDKGLLVIRLLEEYKQCKRHVFINCLRIALIDDIHVVVIEKKENDEFYIARVLKVTLEKKLILSAPFLQEKTIKRYLPFPKEKMAIEELEKELDNPKWTEVLLIQKHDENKMVINSLYYMTKYRGYRYNYIARERMQKTPQDIRIELMEIVEIGGNQFA